MGSGLSVEYVPNQDNVKKYDELYQNYLKKEEETMKSTFIKSIVFFVVFTFLSTPLALAGEQYSFAGIVFQDDQFMRLLQIGMRDGTKEAEAKFYPGNSDGSIDKEIQLVNDYIAQGVDGIAINVLSYESSVPALKRAHEAGIKVVVSGTLLNADFPVSVIESDNKELGQLTGVKCREYIEKHLGGKAKIGILRFKALLPENSRRRVEGFLEEVTKLPGVEIVAREDAWQPEQAIPVTQDMMTAHPEINVIWSANEGGTIGATMAVKQSKMSDKLKVFGTDASIQLANFLLDKDNILQSVTGQQPYAIGSASATALKNALEGKPVEKYTIIHGINLTRKDPAAIKEFIKVQRKLTR